MPRRIPETSSACKHPHPTKVSILGTQATASELDRVWKCDRSIEGSRVYVESTRRSKFVRDEHGEAFLVLIISCVVFLFMGKGERRLPQKYGALGAKSII